MISRFGRIAALVPLYWAIGPAVYAQTTPVITSGGVVEGAQFKGAVTPGGIASVFGTQLADGLLSAGTTPLPIDLGGTRVSVNGVDSPLFFVSSSQINFQVPFETPAGGTADVVVVRHGVSSTTEHVTVAGYSPAVFMNAATREPIVVRYPSNAVITAANPAQPGDVLIIYLTGIGDLTGIPASGSPTPGTQLYSARTNPVVTLGSSTLGMLFAGLTPGFIGLAQINVQLPTDLAQGPSLPLQIKFGSASSVVVQLPVRGGAAPAPSIVVSPTLLDFGSVVIGQTKGVSLTISNGGSAPLTVTGLSAGNGTFSVAPTLLPFVIAAGGQQAVTVNFTPLTVSGQTGILTVASNDPVRASLSVPLSGSGATLLTPKITVSPISLDFGSVTAGASRDLTLTVGNSGNAPLTVSSITSDNPRYAATAPSLPFTVAANSQQTVTVRFSPLASGAQNATLTVASNDPSVPTALVVVAGTAVAVVPVTVLFSDTFDRPDAEMCSLGAANLALGGGGLVYYVPLYAQGVELNQKTLWNGNRDYSGVQFSLLESVCGVSLANWARQDLGIQVDLLVPSNARGDVGQAGPYFRAHGVLAKDFVNGAGSAGYWVQLLNTGEVQIKCLNPENVVAVTGKPATFNSTVYHTLEMSVTGNNLQVALDGKLMTFNQNGTKTTTVSVPALWDALASPGVNNGAAGILFGSEGNRGNIGDQRARNLVVSTTRALAGLPVQSNLP